MLLRLLAPAVLAAIALSSAPLPAAAEGGAAAAPVRIVILPIVVHSAAPDARHVSEGLSDMIASRLEQSGGVFVERPEDPALATTRLGEALREGGARSADFVVYGAFTQFGDGASLDIQCIPVSVASEAEAAAARRIFIQSGAVGDIIPRLDEISGRLGTYVRAGRTPPAAVREGAAQEGDRPVVAAPQAPPPSDALRAISDRLDALEEAVFGGGDTNSAAQFGGTPPES